MRPQGIHCSKSIHAHNLTRADRAAAAAPDLLGRDFSAPAVNQKWCGDLTEIPTEEGKLYLASVEDLASRRVVGFALDDHHDAALADGALKMAAAVRGGDVRGVVFHSDRGSEYTARRFGDACAALGCPSRWAGWARPWTTRRPSRSSLREPRSVVHTL